MRNQEQEMRDYIKFWTKFSQKAQEILDEYNSLSDENKKRAYIEGQRIMTMHGVIGIMEFGKNMELKNLR